MPGAEGNVSEEPSRDKGKQGEDERIEVVREESALQGCTRADGRGSIEPCKARSSIALSRDHEHLARTAIGQRHPEDRRDRARLGCRIDGLTIDADLDRVARADEFQHGPIRQVLRQHYCAASTVRPPVSRQIHDGPVCIQHIDIIERLPSYEQH